MYGFSISSGGRYKGGAFAGDALKRKREVRECKASGEEGRSGRGAMPPLPLWGKGGGYSYF